MRSLRAALAVLMLAAATLSATPAAHAVADPVTCTGYPEARTFLEAQDWWTPLLSGTENFGHVHMGVCFPLSQAQAGTVHFDFRVQLHDNPGVLQNVRIHLLDGNNVNHQVVTVPVKETAAQHCPATPNQCVWTIPVDLDTTVSGTDGYANWRGAAIVTHPGSGGAKQFPGAAWPILLANGGGRPVKNAISPLRIASSAWYQGALYNEAEFLSPLTPTVSGTWTPTVYLHPGAGGINVKHSFVSVDPSFHAVPVNPGVVVLDRAGSYKGTVSIDTTTLANGPHKLFIRADAPCDGTVGNDCGNKPEGGSNNVSTHSSIQTIPFTVAN